MFPDFANQISGQILPIKLDIYFANQNATWVPASDLGPIMKRALLTLQSLPEAVLRGPSSPTTRRVLGHVIAKAVDWHASPYYLNRKGCLPRPPFCRKGRCFHLLTPYRIPTVSWIPAAFDF